MQRFGPDRKPGDAGSAPGEPSTPTPDAAADAVNRWEAEGGRPLPAERPAPMEPAPGGEDEVEEVREELMAAESPDGRPPPARLRRLEWGALGAATLLAILAAWGLLTTQPRSAAWLVAWGLVLLVTVPVWGAALLRGREERRAAVEAKAVVKEEGPRATPGRDASGASGRGISEEAARVAGDRGGSRPRSGG